MLAAVDFNRWLHRANLSLLKIKTEKGKLPRLAVTGAKAKRTKRKLTTLTITRKPMLNARVCGGRQPIGYRWTPEKKAFYRLKVGF
jgi:hypothetical protein